MAELYFSMWTNYCWPGGCRRIIWNEHNCSLPSCGRWLHDLKEKKKRSKSVKCFCFTCLKKNIDSAQKESRLSGYLGFANLTLGLGSSLGPQVYVESEYLISLSCQKPLYEAIRRRAKPSAMGTRTAEGF